MDAETEREPHADKEPEPVARPELEGSQDAHRENADSIPDIEQCSEKTILSDTELNLKETYESKRKRIQNVIDIRSSTSASKAVIALPYTPLNDEYQEKSIFNKRKASDQWTSSPKIRVIESDATPNGNFEKQKQSKWDETESDATSSQAHLISQSKICINTVPDEDQIETQVESQKVSSSNEKSDVVILSDEHFQRPSAEKPSLKSSDESQSLNDSQNILLNFSPSQDIETQQISLEHINMKTLNSFSSSTESLTVMSNPVHPDMGNREDSQTQIIDQNNEGILDPLRKSSSGISLGENPDHDTTVSLNTDSSPNHEFMISSEFKNKPFSNLGYTSSTPEITSLSQKHRSRLSKNIHSSDSDSTPPFANYKIIPITSLPSKSDSSGNLNNNSFSPSSNGHSDGSRLNNFSNINGPSFDVQIHCDEHSEFLALHVIKIDSDIGADVSKECQKMHKKLYRDYPADISRSNSHSSGSSGGLLHLPLPTKASFSSSSSSTSSLRTSDNAFVIPQCPGRNSSIQNFVTIKGLHALKLKIDEVLTHLVKVYNADSPNNSGGSKSFINSFEAKKNISNGNHSDHNENVRNITPRSSKKKIANKTRRTLNRKLKKDILPVTKEEVHLDNEIHSPEMINSDPNRCQRPSTPLTNKKEESTFFNNNNTIHSKQNSPITIVSPKRSTSPSKFDNGCYPEDTVVLAKWRDRKYYPGKVKKALDGCKYQIEFYDGATKTLLDDFIIFGNSKELPILGQSIFAIIEDEVYEPSLVLSLIEVDGTTRYRCTTDRDITVLVKTSDIYVTEDQAKSIRENCQVKSPHSAPNTPRRRINRDLNLDNIIDGPRIPRNRDKSFSKKDALSPSSSKASTSGLSRKILAHKDSAASSPKQRQESESSEGGECFTRAPSTCLEEVSGVQPEIQKTPRKIDGVIAKALLIKGISKQSAGKRSSKVTKFESDQVTNNSLGPIPPKGSTLFKDLHFLLTCTDPPNPKLVQKKNIKSSSSWNDDSAQTTSSTEKEDSVFTTTPFQKERLKEQLESGGGIVYSHFEDVPKNIYGVCKLIAPRPCLTAKYIQCLAANIQPLSHLWVVRSCLSNELKNMEEDALPSGWSIEKNRFVNWEVMPSDRLSSTPFKNHLILLCNDNESFIKFWRRVCTLAGGDTRTVNEEDLNLSGGLVIVTEYDCPHEVQNKASQDNIPLVSTIWVTQCLIEGKICDHNASVKYNFTFNDID